MIIINFDIVTQLAKLSQSSTIVLGSDVPVQIVFSAAPGEVSSLQLALGDDSSAPTVRAYTDTFAASNDTTWDAVLDASDTRLATFMTGKSSAAINLELRAVIDGETIIPPHLSVALQPPIITGPTTSDGGPAYYTEAQVDAAIAAAILGLAPAPTQADINVAAATTAALFAATHFSRIRNKIIAGAGTGAYTASYTVPVGSMTNGAVAEVNVELPASANPTVEIHDNSGTLLASVINAAPAAVAYWYGRFEFDGSAWHPIFRAFQS